MNKPGVYVLMNKITKDIYVGSSSNLGIEIGFKLFYDEICSYSTNIVFKREIRKYKKENLSAC